MVVVDILSEQKDVWDELWTRNLELESEIGRVLPLDWLVSKDWLLEVKAEGDKNKEKAAKYDRYVKHLASIEEHGVWGSINRLDTKLEAVRTARDKLYEDLPTGDVDAFALLKVVQSHIAKLDEIGEGS